MAVYLVTAEEHFFSLPKDFECVYMGKYACLLPSKGPLHPLTHRVVPVHAWLYHIGIIYSLQGNMPDAEVEAGAPRLNGNNLHVSAGEEVVINLMLQVKTLWNVVIFQPTEING